MSKRKTPSNNDKADHLIGGKESILKDPETPKITTIIRHDYEDGNKMPKLVPNAAALKDYGCLNTKQTFKSIQDIEMPKKMNKTQVEITTSEKEKQVELFKPSEKPTKVYKNTESGPETDMSRQTTLSWDKTLGLEFPQIIENRIKNMHHGEESLNNARNSLELKKTSLQQIGVIGEALVGDIEDLIEVLESHKRKIEERVSATLQEFRRVDKEQKNSSNKAAPAENWWQSQKVAFGTDVLSLVNIQRDEIENLKKRIQELEGQGKSQQQINIENENKSETEEASEVQEISPTCPPKETKGKIPCPICGSLLSSHATVKTHLQSLAHNFPGFLCPILGCTKLTRYWREDSYADHCAKCHPKETNPPRVFE